MEVEEVEVQPEDEDTHCQNLVKSQSAARHTYDIGYQKWEAFEEKTARAQATKKVAVEVDTDSESEELPEDAAGIRYRCPQLAECLKEASGTHFKFQLYVHDGFLTYPEGDELLEVLLGPTVASSCSSLGRGHLRQFRHLKELSIELPRHSRLELRLKRGQSVLGSTLVDLQDRRLCSLREKESTCELRQLWSPDQPHSVGSLYLWLRVVPMQEFPAPQLWPGLQEPFRAELRVILHEVQFCKAVAAEEVVACAELDMAVERLHGHRLPAPQCSDARPLQGSRASFEWRFTFPKLRLITGEVSLALSLLDAKTWELLGQVTQSLKDPLKSVSAAADRPAQCEFNSLTVKAVGKSYRKGSMSISVSALPKHLAEDFPASSGRAAGKVPWDQDTARSVKEQEFSAQRLQCCPPAVSCRPARPRRRRRRWWLAA
ncbi:unnamed protein product, partial [Effrenium voratum]